MTSERRRIQLIDLRTRQPVDQGWTPSVEPWEIEDANSRMEQAGLPMRWQPLGEQGTLTQSYGM